jgi:hypothetical protein
MSITPDQAAATAASDSNTGRQYTLFAALLSAAVLFHQVQLGDWEIFSLHAIVSLAAIFCLLRPSDPRRLLLLLSAHLVVVLVEMPFNVNHWLLLAFVDVTVLIAVGIGLLRRDRSALAPASLYRGIAPTVRAMVLLVYFFAAIAKVNDSFLDEEISCGTHMIQVLFHLGPLNIDSSPLNPLGIWGTIAIELTIPLLLLFRRTRVLGVLVGGAFHFSLFVEGHMPFSGFALAFYALFLPDDMPERFDRLVAQQPLVDRAATLARTIAHHPLTFPLAAAGWLAVAALLTYGPEDVDLGGVVLNGAQLVFAFYYMALGAVLLLCLLQGRPFRYRPGFLRVASPVWLLGPILVIANAMTPYLGLKTQTTFTMYSNLQTEAGQWNHLLFPESMRIFGYQDEAVEIVESNDAVLASAAENGRSWLLYALRQRTADHPDMSVTYVRNGERVVASRAGDDPVLSDSPNPILGKVFVFRDVPPADENGCRQARGGGAQQGS